LRPVFLDANVLLRLATRVPGDLYERAKALVARAEENGQPLFVHPLHVATAVYVLSGYYEYAPAKVFEVLSIVLNLRPVRVVEEARVFGALKEMSRTGVDVDDAFLALLAREHGGAVASFDRDFKKLGVAWIEP